MEKAYSRWIPWKNKPSTTSPIDEIALNKISNGLDTIDNRVIVLDSTALKLADAMLDIVNISVDNSNGTITATRRDGSTVSYDTLLEKIAVNFRFDADTQSLVIELDDGTEQIVDLSSFITETEFDSSSTIFFEVSEHHVSASVRAGSITEDLLQPDFLADTTAQADRAEAARDAADQYADNAQYDADLARSYAVGYEEFREDSGTDNARSYRLDAEAWAIGKRGGSDVVSGDDTFENNSKYYAEKAKDTVLGGGLMFLDINGDGDLIMTKTSNVDYIDFAIVNNEDLEVSVTVG